MLQICYRMLSKWAPSRTSRPEVFCKKIVLRNSVKFTGKHLSRSIFFNKVAGLSPATLLKRDSGTGIFLWILRNFKTTFYIEHLWWLLRIYTSCSCIKCLRSTCEILFFPQCRIHAFFGDTVFFKLSIG